LPDEQSPDQPEPGAPRDAEQAPPPNAGGLTAGGYSYNVVNDDEEAVLLPPAPPSEGGRKVALAPWLLGALIVVPVIVVGAAAWFVASQLTGGGGGGDRLERNVTNVVNAFSQSGDGGAIIRYEGELPPAFPDEMPLYPGADVISSIVQLQGDDAGYIVVLDTTDSRQDVANYFSEALAEDPWQVEIEQAGRESTVLQFSNIENPDIEGVVLAAESKNDQVTTIFMSVQVVGAASENEPEEFDPGQSRPLPAGFPADQIPQYPDSIAIETGYQQAPNARQFVISAVTQDDPSDVMQYYRDLFQSNGWTVEDAPAGSSSLESGEALSFTSADGETSGTLEAGELPEDENFTRINLQVQTSG
jgi:hypothetical protein